MTRRTFLDRVKTWAELISFMAVITAVPLFFWQQRESMWSTRVANAMQFIIMSNSGEIAQARISLSKPWTTFDTNRFMTSNPPRAAIRKMKRDVTAGVDSETVMETTDFYSSVILCRNSNICDKDTIDVYFRSSITAFYCTYDDRISEIATTNRRSNYGLDLRRYSDDCSG